MHLWASRARFRLRVRTVSATLHLELFAWWFASISLCVSVRTMIYDEKDFDQPIAFANTGGPSWCFWETITIMNTDPAFNEHLRQLEELITKPEVRRSPEELGRLLSDDFREFGGSGRVFDKGQIIAALQNQLRVQLWLDNFQVKRLTPDVALVTYHGHCRVPESETVSHSLRSSIWMNRDGRWEVVFHQGTPSAQAVEAVRIASPGRFP